MSIDIPRNNIRNNKPRLETQNIPVNNGIIKSQEQLLPIEPKTAEQRFTEIGQKCNNIYNQLKVGKNNSGAFDQLCVIKKDLENLENDCLKDQNTQKSINNLSGALESIDNLKIWVVTTQSQLRPSLAAGESTRPRYLGNSTGYQN